jgi:hypothetical protein
MSYLGRIKGTANELIDSVLNTLKVSLHDSYGNVIGSNNESLNTMSYFERVSQGLVAGAKIIQKYGKNPAVGTVGFSTIWNGGGVYTGFPSTAETVTITSLSVNDTNTAGTGMRSLRMYGLSASGLEQTEDILLNGTTPVTSTLSYLRLNKAKGLTGGTLAHNDGNITIRQSVTTANIFAVMPATYNSTMIAAYTIPADKNGYLLSQRSAIANKTSAAVDIRIKVRQPGNLFTVNGEAALNSQGSGFINIDFKIPSQLPPLTDLFIEAEASANVAVTAFFDILLVDI